MKKTVLLLSGMGVLTLILLLAFLGLDPSPKATPFITGDSVPTDWNAKLYYTNLPPSKVKAYQLTSQDISSLPQKYTPYTEGFLEEPTYTQWLSLVETFCKETNRPVPSYFYNYYEDSRLVILAFVGGLDHVFILDKLTNELRPLAYTQEQDLGQMYAFHFQVSGDQLILVGGKANSYDSFLYTISLPDARVTKSLTLATDSHAASKTQTAIAPNGMALFLGNNKVLMADPSSGEQTTYPLDFQPLGLTTSPQGWVVYGYGETAALPYLQFNSQLELVKEGSLALPSPTHGILTAHLTEDTLYLATSAAPGAFYQNYVAVYDLSTDTLMSCIGLETFEGHSLSAVSFSQLPD